MILGLAFLLALPLVHADGDAQSWRYVAGAGVGVADHAGGVCFTEWNPAPGGVCDVPLQSTQVSVEVVDDVTGHVGFAVQAYDNLLAVCYYGYHQSPAVIDLPAGCVSISVMPGVGSLAGTITASS